MAKHHFTSTERYAVFTTHSAKCYMCGNPVDMQGFEVDRVIPESLLDEPERLAKVLHDLGRPDTFNVKGLLHELVTSCDLSVQQTLIATPSIVWTLGCRENEGLWFSGR